MTMYEVQFLEDYFDPFDIQIYSHVFLIYVLELLVCWNFLREVHGVDNFAFVWMTNNPDAYDRLHFIIDVDDVFVHQEIESVGFRVLESALNKLISWRFPQGTSSSLL